MWLDERHHCALPLDEVPRTDPSTRYWLCPDCGTQFKVTVGEYGGRWTGPDGEELGWAVSYQRISNGHY